jgi:plastocyanin
MSRRLATWAATAVLVVAACSSGGGAPSGRAAVTPAGATQAASAIATSSAPAVTATASAAASTAVDSPAPPSGSSSPAACAETTRPGAVAVRIEDFSFGPDTIKAHVGEVIAFTNTGFESHNATIDGGACGTRTLKTGEHDGLVVTTVGRLGFHCTVHTWMTGTITVEQ